MNTATAIRTIAAAAGGHPVVFVEDGLGGLARRVADRPNHLYLNGPSGLVSSIGIGVAVHARATTVVVDEPDSLLTNLAAVVTAGMLDELPLVHVVLDSSTPRSVDGATLSGHTDLCGLVLAAGYRRAYIVDRAEMLANLIRTEIAHCPSPVFVHCLLADGLSPARAPLATGGSRRRTGPANWLREVA